ncbi:MAG: DNA topoisomerase I [Planctomycetes bacterium RIFCSPHIGHO2_02_FULL_50_42]|nr:MAG: DNA topoisomerase I [Planctomycetes bacterium GWA2_50_13]OHB87583.1 MAG: DNA topoisomerase I [Planctomycetes bacterium RIFCSPHIGHO2_02_FULL_50_42]OHB96029.1 MAG: DNA topoisomerase I [Planctomycetes bacterium RIFCSPLOWO2_02_FULL_50_16]
MPKRIVIVESPTKAKTINKFLGSKFTVRSSMGHVRDLPANKLAVNVEKDFEPEYRIMPKRREMVKSLKAEVKDADEVYLAPDHDREGEAIAWHLCQALDIPDKKARRVVFNEITEEAIKNAFEHPVGIDMDKVNAQQARRILDRLVGYKISPLLWKKITKGLSAGRVQSVAVRLLVEREKEIRAFKPVEYWNIVARLRSKGARDKGFEAKLWKQEDSEVQIGNEAAAAGLVETLKDSKYIVGVISKQRKLNKPLPPFTTSQLQQQAAIQLNFSTKRTMLVAQQLYEGVELKGGPMGLITYMRTDSYNVSKEAVTACRRLIPGMFGDGYLPQKPNYYAARKGAQQAHEAIRPTSVEIIPESIKQYLTRDQHRLYELIWRRFVASQMTPAEYETIDVTINAGSYKFKAKGKMIVFPGHNILTESIQEEPLPDVQEGEELKLIELVPSQHFTEPPPRYTEASLVKILERKGIGRPSTYSVIISTIQDRGYVQRENKTLHPTELGILVTEKLVKHFPKVLNVEFTSHMEEELDKVEEAKLDWVGVLREFYTPFQEDLKSAVEEMESEKVTPEGTDIKCGKCGSPMVVRWSRAGKFLGCSAFPKCKFTMDIGGNNKPRTAEATGEVCEKCGSPMVIKAGRMGRFLACSAYPECKNAKSLPTGVKCPKEGCGGDVVQRRSKRGRRFYGCSNYPKCNFTAFKLPEGSAAASPD